MLTRTVMLGAALVFGLATGAGATIASPPFGASGSLTVKIAEGCGPGWWRGPRGACHPMANNRRCPPGYHLGPQGRRCWPN